ncbi:MAG: hypothetical protein IKL47_13075 [Clostridia bacterium]|nr:hypothetical protein [Clostridia bacterium]
MKKIFLIILILLVTSCSRNIVDENQVSHDNNSESSITTGSFDQFSEKKADIDYDYYLRYAENKTENEIDLPSSYDDYIEFNFVVPNLDGTDKSELPFVTEENELYVDETGIIEYESEYLHQYICNTEEAIALAKSIALLSAHHSTFNIDYGSKKFDVITDASEKELLWAAILKTPQRSFPENENHAFNVTMESLYGINGYSSVAQEIYAASDVEDTFRYLFGNEANFVPQNIERFGIRYFEELGIFVQFFDGIISSQRFPQIVSYSKNNEKYTVETVFVQKNSDGSFEFYVPFTNGTWESFELNNETVDLLLKIGIHYTYVFEKDDNGHFVLCGFSY